MTSLSRRTLLATSPALVVSTATVATSAAGTEPTARLITSAENNAIHQHLQTEFVEDCYSTFFSEMRFESVEGRTLKVYGDCDIKCDLISKYLTTYITSACRRVLGVELESIHFRQHRVVRV